MPTLPWLETFAALYFLWVVGASLTLLTQRRSPTATLAWIFAFAALPVVSGIYYVVFGPRRLKRRKLRYGNARNALAGEVRSYLRQSCCQAPPLLSPEAASLAGVVDRLGQGGPTMATSIAILEDGDECLAALERDIAAARDHVHCEYYIWEPDRVGARIRDALAAAARRGLQVRVIFDALGSPDVDPAFWEPLTSAGGAVLAFNRVRLSLASLNFANFRTHRKIVVVDGVIGTLEPMAAGGIPTAARLAQGLDSLEQGLTPVEEKESPDWLGRTAGNLSSLIDLHPADQEAVPGQGAVRDSRRALLLQDLTGAIAALTPLADQGNEAAKAWIDRARQRIAAGDAVDTLRQHLKTMVARQG